MEPITPVAENRIRISRALFNEGMRAAESKGYKRSVKRTAAVLLTLFSAAAAWLLYAGGSLMPLLGEAVFLGALLFWLTIMLPGTRRRSKYKAMMHGTDGIPERAVVFYPESLTVRANDGKETRIPYKDILDYQETENLYILNCKDRISVLLDKKGFSAGNFEAVRKLL